MFVTTYRSRSAMLGIVLISSLLTACGSPPADKTAAKGPASVQEIAMYEGADRQQMLLAGAKKEEGSLNLYTSIAEKDLVKITADFEKRYGVKVNAWRSGADQVRQRVITEARADKHFFDVVHMSTREMEAVYREKLLQEVRSPHFNDLIPGAVLPHKQWTATLLSVFVQAYNTNQVKKEELPKTYEELLDAKWKGRLGIEATDYDWFYTVVNSMGEEKGLQFFRALVKNNGISVRKGHSLLNNMVVSGEVPLALTVYNYMPQQSKQQGAPADSFLIEPAIARPDAVGMSEKAPHPYAAALFYDYLLSDAQTLLAELNYVPTNTKAESPMKNTKVTLIDSSVMLDESEKWLQLFEDVFVKRN